MTHPIVTNPTFARSAEEVQRAHDQLEAFVLEEIPIRLPSNVLTDAARALDVLCWLLGHESGKSFAANLDMLERFAVGHGYRLREIAEPPKED